MAINSRNDRASAFTAMVPINIPSIVPDALGLERADRYQAFWSYLSVPGGVLFFGTVMGNGVDSDSYDGITMDASGNLRISGTYYP